MNTERDNFYDWAKDKPDASSFAGLHRAHLTHEPVRSSAMPWGRMALFVAVAVAVAASLKMFVL